MARYSATESIGVNAVETIVLRDIGWIFRAQPVVDMGIDAHVELVEDGDPTGQLIGVQIKSGPSHVRETAAAYVFRGTMTHLNYWINHSLPVILVLHLPEPGETFWVQITAEKVTRHEKGWTIEIPKSNKLGRESKPALQSAFDGSPEQQRMRKLAIDEPLMRHIKTGGKVSIELEQWINKSLGRSPVKVFVYDNEGVETLQQEWGVMYTGYTPTTLAKALFPWARARVDEEFYEANADDEDPRQSLMRAIDRDNGYYSSPRNRQDIYPYTNSSGEVNHYRLELTLNSLGKAYLQVSGYASRGEATVIPKKKQQHGGPAT